MSLASLFSFWPLLPVSRADGNLNFSLVSSALPAWRVLVDGRLRFLFAGDKEWNIQDRATPPEQSRLLYRQLAEEASLHKWCLDLAWQWQASPCVGSAASPAAACLLPPPALPSGRPAATDCFVLSLCMSVRSLIRWMRSQERAKPKPEEVQRFKLVPAGGRLAHVAGIAALRS